MQIENGDLRIRINLGRAQGRTREREDSAQEEEEEVKRSFKMPSYQEFSFVESC